jgi:hypothetical protein
MIIETNEGAGVTDSKYFNPDGSVREYMKIVTLRELEKESRLKHGVEWTITQLLSGPTLLVIEKQW